MPARVMKGRDLQGVNQQPHKRAAQPITSTSGKATSGEIPPKANRFGEEDAGKGDHRPHRQIDPAGEDHEGHAHGDDPEEGVIRQDIADHPR